MICKGKGRAKGCGCGNVIKEAKYGLGLECCYKLWLTTTENGAKEISRILKEVSRKSKALASSINALAKIDILSAEEYRKKILQPNINLAIRLIDNGQPCISTGAKNGKMSAGHYVDSKEFRTLSFNFHNIFIQAFHSNHHKSGNILNYQDGIIEIFGRDYFEYIHGLRKMDAKTFTKQIYKELNIQVKILIKEFKSNLKIRTPGERIHLRNYANSKLKIYSGSEGFYNKNKSKEFL